MKLLKLLALSVVLTACTNPFDQHPTVTPLINPATLVVGGTVEVPFIFTDQKHSFTNEGVVELADPPAGVHVTQTRTQKDSGPLVFSTAANTRPGQYLVHLIVYSFSGKGQGQITLNVIAASSQTPH